MNRYTPSFMNTLSINGKISSIVLIGSKNYALYEFVEYKLLISGLLCN